MRFSAVAVSALLVFNSTLALAVPKKEMAATGPVQVTRGNLAGLAATKRIALTSCVVDFQTSAFVENEGSMLNRNTTRAVNKLTDAPRDALQGVVDDACVKLRADLTAAGYELVPQAEIAAQASYQKMLALTGIKGPVGHKSLDGGSVVLGSSDQPLYLPCGNELSVYYQSAPPPEAAYKQAVPDATEPPSAMARSRTFDLPQLEIDLAKALNAHVVKAWTVVRFSSVNAESRRDWSYQGESIDMQGNRVGLTATDYKATSAAQLGVREHQTHLAVRLATGKPDFKPSFATGAKAPARDGDIVLTLVAPILMSGSEQYLSVENAGSKESGTSRMSRAAGLLGGALGSRGNTVTFSFTTRIADAANYRKAAAFAVGEAQNRLVQAMAAKGP